MSQVEAFPQLHPKMKYQCIRFCGVGLSFGERQDLVIAEILFDPQRNSFLPLGSYVNPVEAWKSVWKNRKSDSIVEKPGRYHLNQGWHSGIVNQKACSHGYHTHTPVGYD